MIINGRYFHYDVESGEYVEIDEITHRSIEEWREKFKRLTEKMIKESGYKPPIQIMSTSADDFQSFDKNLPNESVNPESKTTSGLYKYFTPHYLENKKEDDK